MLSAPGIAYSAAADAVVPEQMLTSWGYKSTTLKYPLQYCDPKLSTGTQRRAQSIRSLLAVADDSHTYFRYNLIYEQYNSSQAAQQRLDSFRLPSTRDTLYSKTCELQIGFRHGNNVYIIHTDALAFTYDERERLFKLFKNYTEQATNK